MTADGLVPVIEKQIVIVSEIVVKKWSFADHNSPLELVFPSPGWQPSWPLLCDAPKTASCPEIHEGIGISTSRTLTEERPPIAWGRSSGQTARRTWETSTGRKQTTHVPPSSRTLGYTIPLEPRSIKSAANC